jgi:RNA polymerase sigma factor (sigma-70 family)
MEPLRIGLLASQPDVRLAELAARGHERPFEVLVARHRSALERYCRRLLPDGQAEDAVQQALLHAWRALQAGVAVADVRPWLYAIARNQAMTVLRSRKHVEPLADDVPAARADGHLEARATLRAAFGALAGMRPAQREALVRTALGGEPQEAIARDLGLSGGAVRQLVHRARADLRAAAAAVIPWPLIEWASSASAGSVAAGALRGGAAVAAVGAALTAAPAVVHHAGHPAPAGHHRVATPVAPPPAPAAPHRVPEATVAATTPHRRVHRRPVARTVRRDVVAAVPPGAPAAPASPQRAAAVHEQPARPSGQPAATAPSPAPVVSPPPSAGAGAPAAGAPTSPPAAAPAPPAPVAPRSDDRGEDGGRDAQPSPPTAAGVDDHGGASGSTSGGSGGGSGRSSSSSASGRHGGGDDQQAP